MKTTTYFYILIVYVVFGAQCNEFRLCNLLDGYEHFKVDESCLKICGVGVNEVEKVDINHFPSTDEKKWNCFLACALDSSKIFDKKSGTLDENVLKKALPNQADFDKFKNEFKAYIANPTHENLHSVTNSLLKDFYNEKRCK